MCAADREGVKTTRLLENLESDIAMALKCQLLFNHGDGSLLFARIVEAVVDLRGLSAQYLHHIFNARVDSSSDVTSRSAFSPASSGATSPSAASVSNVVSPSSAASVSGIVSPASIHNISNVVSPTSNASEDGAGGRCVGGMSGDARGSSVEEMETCVARGVEEGERGGAVAADCGPQRGVGFSRSSSLSALSQSLSACSADNLSRSSSFSEPSTRKPAPEVERQVRAPVWSQGCGDVREGPKTAEGSDAAARSLGLPGQSPPNRAPSERQRVPASLGAASRWRPLFPQQGPEASFRQHASASPSSLHPISLAVTSSQRPTGVSPSRQMTSMPMTTNSQDVAFVSSPAHEPTTAGHDASPRGSPPSLLLAVPVSSPAAHQAHFSLTAPPPPRPPAHSPATPPRLTAPHAALFPGQPGVSPAPCPPPPLYAGHAAHPPPLMAANGLLLCRDEQPDRLRDQCPASGHPHSAWSLPESPSPHGGASPRCRYSSQQRLSASGCDVASGNHSQLLGYGGRQEKLFLPTAF